MSTKTRTCSFLHAGDVRSYPLLNARQCGLRISQQNVHSHRIQNKTDIPARNPRPFNVFVRRLSELHNYQNFTRIPDGMNPGVGQSKKWLYLLWQSFEVWQ